MEGDNPPKKKAKKAPPQKAPKKEPGRGKSTPRCPKKGTVMAPAMVATQIKTPKEIENIKLEYANTMARYEEQRMKHSELIKSVQSATDIEAIETSAKMLIEIENSAMQYIDA